MEWQRDGRRGWGKWNINLYTNTLCKPKMKWKLSNIYIYSHLAVSPAFYFHIVSFSLYRNINNNCLQVTDTRTHSHQRRSTTICLLIFIIYWMPAKTDERKIYGKWNETRTISRWALTLDPFAAVTFVFGKLDTRTNICSSLLWPHA